MICYQFSCECGYETKEWLWIQGFERDPARDIERELTSSEDGEQPMHPETRKVWEELLHHPLVEAERERVARLKSQPRKAQPWELGPRFTLQRRDGELILEEIPQSPDPEPSEDIPEPFVLSVWELGHCYHCATLSSYLRVVNRETKEVLHMSRCRSCGWEVEIVDLEHVPCPKCKSHIEPQQLAME